MNRKRYAFLIFIVGFVFWNTIDNRLVSAALIMFSIGMFVSDLIGPPEDGKHKKSIRD